MKYMIIQRIKQVSRQETHRGLWRKNYFEDRRLEIEEGYHSNKLN